jgi:hypothetical protein
MRVRTSLEARTSLVAVERRRLDDGASSPLMIHVFDVADQIAEDF